MLCVDEKSQIQALDRTQPILPMQPGLIERRSHDYVRHGTTTLFAALDIATGQVTAALKPRHRNQEFLAFLKQIERAYRDAVDAEGKPVELHLVMDNYAAHKHANVKAWLADNPRFKVHFTPTHASWMNLVEVWFGIVERQAIRRGVFTSVKNLNAKIRAFGGDVTSTGDGATRILVSKEPVGPCVLVTPWNFPLAMGTRKIGPAIAAGCTIVFKPSELTPLTSLALVDVLVEAGVPKGVLNVVPTTAPGEVVSTWMSSGIARKISFTGSTAVGIRLLEQASQHVMRSSMELGGNAPLIVFEDADLDRAVDGALAAKMRNMGEACTAANRIFVHRAVADRFAEKLAARMDALAVGDGLVEGTQVGPLVEEKALTKVERLVADAVERGARVVCGGSRPEGPGYFYPPTVLADVSKDAALMSEEIFGPVAPIVVFDTEDEVVEIANNTPWGLAGYIFTQDVDRSFRVSEALEVGMIGLNTGIVSNPAAPSTCLGTTPSANRPSGCPGRHPVRRWGVPR